MKQEKDFIEAPFGAKDSELEGFEYTIPQGYEAEIKDGKVIVRKAESEDEKIRKEIIKYIQGLNRTGCLTSQYSTEMNNYEPLKTTHPLWPGTLYPETINPIRLEDGETCQDCQYHTHVEFNDRNEESSVYKVMERWIKLFNENFKEEQN